MIDAFLYPSAYGAVGDGATDDTKALQAWITACLQTGNAGWLSPTANGYVISAPLVASGGYHLTIRGPGSSSKLLMKNPTQDGLQIGVSGHVEIGGFDFQGASAATAGAAINFTTPTNGALVDNIRTSNVWVGIHSNALAFAFTRLDIAAKGACLVLNNPGDSTVGVNSRLTPMASTAQGVVVNNPAGLKLADIKINSPIPYAYGVNAVVTVSDGDFFLLAPSSVEGFLNAGLIFSKPTGSSFTFGNLVISAQFAQGGPSGYIVFLPSNDPPWVSALAMVGVTGNGTHGCLISGVKSGVVTGCTTSPAGPLTITANNGKIVQGANNFAS